MVVIIFLESDFFEHIQELYIYLKLFPADLSIDSFHKLI